ncbi:MAG: hypothetical protein KF828_07855 [Anaerolineales bacterium]|nr:hypothetical protein [Anaerolineales bacterium]
MDNVGKNLTEIISWAGEATAKSPTTNEDFMDLFVAAMSRCLYLAKITTTLAAPEELKNGFPRNTAIVVGHIVRLCKLYEGFLYHTVNRQQEMGMILFRLIFEAAVKTEYLIDNDTTEDSFKSFVITSYQSEKGILKDLIEKQNQRPLTPIESRMLKTIRRNLKTDQLSEETILQNKNWKLDGKSMRDLLTDLDKELGYVYLFSSSSHYIHGDWFDLKWYHLTKGDGDLYFPHLQYTNSDPRPAAAGSIIVLHTIQDFLKWRKTNVAVTVELAISAMLDLIRKLDFDHENTLQSQNTAD